MISCPSSFLRASRNLGCSVLTSFRFAYWSWAGERSAGKCSRSYKGDKWTYREPANPLRRYHGWLDRKRYFAFLSSFSHFLLHSPLLILFSMESSLFVICWHWGNLPLCSSSRPIQTCSTDARRAEGTLTFLLPSFTLKYSCLKVPYFPLLGNHDVWSYKEPLSQNSWEGLSSSLSLSYHSMSALKVSLESEPTGDELFVETFGDIFSKHNITRDFSKKKDPVSGYNVTLINFEIQVSSESTSDRLVILALDYNERTRDLSPFAFYKGVGPSADLHLWPGGMNSSFS